MSFSLYLGIQTKWYINDRHDKYFSVTPYGGHATRDLRFAVKQGMTYIVPDNLSSNCSATKDGVKPLIIDGDFLKNSA